MSRKCGSDALQYIKFQRHLTIFVLIITVVCMAIILPINFTMGSIQVRVRYLAARQIQSI